MGKGLVITAITLFLIMPLVWGQEELVCEYPSDYATKGDIAVVNSYYSKLLDDSASTRRMIEVNTRKLDELKARQWASSGEVENLSKATNASILQLREDTALEFERFEGVIVGRIQTVKVESIMLLMVAVFSLFTMSNWIYGSKYRELEKKMGVFPRKVPMTTKEKGLEARVNQLESMLKSELEKEKHPPSRLREIIGGILRIVMVIVGAVLLIFAVVMGMILSGVL